MSVFKQSGILIIGLLFSLACFTSASCSKTTEDAKPYTDAQFAALQALVNSASTASFALSGEDFAEWEKARPALGDAITNLQTAFGPEAFNGLIKHVEGGWPDLAKASDLAKARAAYLKVSDNLAQIVLVARKKDSRLSNVIVYYCSMTADPADARWVQMAPPLSNPFWGVYMLDCCRELKP